MFIQSIVIPCTAILMNISGLHKEAGRELVAAKRISFRNIFWDKPEGADGMVFQFADPKDPQRIYSLFFVSQPASKKIDLNFRATGNCAVPDGSTSLYFTTYPAK
jgi:hypothetical protein